MPFPMIKDEGKLEISHNKIYEAIEEYLYQGQKVGMITIGDPSIYSTYMYMHKRARANGWRAEIVSGVPSFCAVAARLGISLGEKGEEIHIIPSSDNIENTFSYNGTLIYMKSGRGLKQLVKALRTRQEAGEMYEINAVSNCGMDSEKVYHSLEELENADVYLTTVIVKRKKKNN
jgi:sirohydrochlorin cobaltochelatase